MSWEPKKLDYATYHPLGDVHYGDCASRDEIPREILAQGVSFSYAGQREQGFETFRALKLSDFVRQFAENFGVETQRLATRMSFGKYSQSVHK